MSKAPTLEAQFADLADPRTGDNVQHKLLDIVIIAILAVICGAEGWTDVAEFGKAKAEWVQRFLELPHGIPSHDTFRTVFMRLDAQAFQQCFINWVQAVHTLTQGQVVALDGKCLRGTQDSYLGKQAIYMVSAWATADHLVLGQRKVDEKSNEITAVPELLALLPGAELVTGRAPYYVRLWTPLAWVINKVQGKGRIRPTANTAEDAP